ncbi:MAG: hypothetical protein KME59_21360 [Trichormus sp. ATA11-4-KO1]|jgi:hypothetical protein|nr:hypothetical protein [Trichormus sp. ATA11-4-KO1]
MSRLTTTQARRNFTSVLARHNVNDFRSVTNLVYRELFGLDANGLREAHGLPDGTNLRESLPGLDLAAITMLEAYVAINIDNFNSIEDAISYAATEVKDLLA